MDQSPLKDMLDEALASFKNALVEQKVYDEGHPNLNRAYNGACDFVRFLVDGPKALKPRPPRKG